MHTGTQVCMYVCSVHKYTHTWKCIMMSHRCLCWLSALRAASAQAKVVNNVAHHSHV